VCLEKAAHPPSAINNAQREHMHAPVNNDILASFRQQLLRDRPFFGSDCARSPKAVRALMARGSYDTGVLPLHVGGAVDPATAANDETEMLQALADLHEKTDAALLAGFRKGRMRRPSLQVPLPEQGGAASPTVDQAVLLRELGGIEPGGPLDLLRELEGPFFDSLATAHAGRVLYDKASESDQGSVIGDLPLADNPVCIPPVICYPACQRSR
jgi:hypothetical protein